MDRIKEEQEKRNMKGETERENKRRKQDENKKGDRNSHKIRCERMMDRIKGREREKKHEGRSGTGKQRKKRRWKPMQAESYRESVTEWSS